MLTPFRKLVTGDQAIDRIQDSVGEAMRSTQACPLLDGVLITGVKLVAANYTQTEHQLNRIPRGYLVVRRSANAVVYDDQANNESLAERCLKLRASANVTVDIWVF